MSKTFLTPVGLFSAASDPASGSAGNIYFNSSSNVIRIYYNSVWNTIHNGTASLGFNTDFINFSTNPTSTASTARLQWSAGEGTLSFGLTGGNVFLNIGQEEVALCYNGTGSALTAGTVVYISGAQGQRPSVAKASALDEGGSSKTLGIVAENIANGAEGFICTSGIVRDVNTAAFAPGTPLWLSTTAGEITSAKSYAPNHLVFIGYSIKQNASSGQIFVKIQNGFELYELHNVSASAPANNDILIYNGSSSLWLNSSSANLTNLTVTNTISGRAASANVATHAGTASSIAGSLVTGYVASATVATTAGHASTASSINASLLTGTTLASNVVNSSLTSVGTLTNLTVTNTISGRSASANVSTHAGTASSIAGSLVTGYVASATVATSAGHASTASSINSSLITGTTLPAAIVSSSLTGLGTLGSLTVSGNTNIDSGTLFVDSSGFVGMGTTSNIGGKVNIVNDVSGSVGLLIRGAAGQSVSTFRIQSSGGTNTVNVNGETGGAYFEGNFGIGVLIPTTKLDVNGSALIRTNASVTGNLLVDTNTLFVDATNNEVGILTTSPASALHVAGGLLINGNASFGGTSSFGPTTFYDAEGINFSGAGTAEGGQINLRGGSSHSSSVMQIDNYQGSLRILHRNGTAESLTVAHANGSVTITSSLTVNGTITGTSTTQAAGNNTTSLATTAFVSRAIKYSEDISVNTSSVAGFFVFNISGTASLGGVIMMPRGTAARVIVGQANTGINGTASPGFVRGYVENNAGTAVTIGGAVPFYYMAW